MTHGHKQNLGIAISLMLLGLATIVPICWVKYPALLDYPNHLASSYVLRHLHDPSLLFQQWYGAHWGLYPYLTTDVVLLALQRVMPIEAAGRLYLCLAVLALPPAMWFFLRQANPGQDAIALWAWAGVHNIFFLLGYVNFYVSLACVFLALGIWLKWLGRPRLLLWFWGVLAFTCVYFSHLVTFGVAGIAITAYCLFARRPARILFLSWAMLLPGACCYLYSARVIEKQPTGFIFLDLTSKIENLRALMHGYSNGLDAVTLAAIPAYFFAAWFRNREFGWNWRWVAVGAVLFALYFALPWAYGDGSDLDIRVLPILFGIMLAFARVGRRGWWLAPLVLAVFFARVGNVTQTYRGMQPELQGLAASFEVTVPNARVLPIIQADEDSDGLHHPFAHFWAYGVIRRQWFSHYLFELPGLNVLRITHDSYTLDGFWDLDYRDPPDWGAIQTDYDYVWCYNVPQFATGLETIGKLVYADGKLRLYRIHPRSGDRSR